VSAASDYVRFTLHPYPGSEDAAVTTLLELPTPGWQELSSGAGMVFWLAGAVLDDSSVCVALERLRETGSLEATPETGDWERRWRTFHKPVRVGRILVRPPWAPPEPEALDVIVDVGMAFGTGAHHTTRQCLRLLQQIAPGPLLDVGCGTGVLSVAAVRLGYALVSSVDNDELATSATAANALLNGVGLELMCADVTDPSFALPEVEVLVANLALRPIVALGARLQPAATARSERLPAASGEGRAMSTGPRDVILAGLLAVQVDEALRAWPAYEVAARLQDAEWCALHLRPPSQDVGSRGVA
jgi:ribosomal protein L11 methyltransferase